MSEAPASSAVPSPLGDGMGALNVACKFEIARAAGQWDQAWAVLAPFSRARIGSLDRFIALETAYNEAGGSFAIDSVVAGPFDETTTKVYFAPGVLDDFARAGGDLSQAYLVYLTHPDEAGASASSSAYLIAPVSDGWRIWIVH